MKSEWTVKSFSADIHPDSGFYHAAKEKPIGDVFDSQESLARAISTAGSPVNLISLYGGDAVQIIPAARIMSRFHKKNLLASRLVEPDYEKALSLVRKNRWTNSASMEAVTVYKGGGMHYWEVWRALSKARLRTASINTLVVLTGELDRLKVSNWAGQLVLLGLAERVRLGVYRGLYVPNQAEIGTQKHLCALIKITGNCTVQRAANILNVKYETARKHLCSMEKEGILERAPTQPGKRGIHKWRIPNG